MSRTRTVLALTGILIIGYAVTGALDDPDLAPAGVLTFLAGVLIVHDFLWMPVLLAVGAAIARLTRGRKDSERPGEDVDRPGDG
ncbi:hypothetical protein [Actinoplanes derwentensis]|uniref:Uncharacterized protein n=1 Tax=Actinoplanes derwentensis TaxID=113562 RepID=A0A1H1UJT4_9ACTN|nr:hypothetical protein [Actinoplanes derwentensis]GID88085.1 hypothetical protein Ade03nite_70090 [Actinoplanes derwentensis]SDS72723.1 hypothetical protein SAMN04489716_1461 [Actinoplanes derwentensis]